MGEVFLSYAREDSATANALADALSEEGFAVWADVSSFILGDQYDQVVAKALDAAGCVVVLWSQHSVQSHWVKDEAAYARDHGTLIPVRIESVSPPMGFGSIHTGSLVGWSGERDRPDYQALLRALKLMLDDEDGTPVDEAPSQPVIDTTQRLQQAIAEASRPATENASLEPNAEGVSDGTDVMSSSNSLPPAVDSGPTQPQPPPGNTPPRSGHRLGLVLLGLAAVAAVAIGVSALWPGTEVGPTTTLDVVDLDAAVAASIAPTGWPGFDPTSDITFVTGAVRVGDGFVVLGTGHFDGETQSVVWPLDAEMAIGDAIRVTPVGEDVELHAMVAFEGTLVAGGDRADADAVVFASSDGQAWTEATIDGQSAPPASVRAISVGESGYVAAGYTTSSEAPRSAALWTSVDGLDWQRVADVIDADVSQQLDSVAVHDSVVVAAGRDGSPTQGGMRPLVMLSEDAGVTWESVDAPSVGDGSRMQAVTWTGREFVAVGWSLTGQTTSPVVWQSENGQVWDVVWFPGASPDGSSAMLVSVAQTDLGLVAAGAVSEGDSAVVATWGATSREGWTRLDWLADVAGDPAQEVMPSVLVPVEGGALIGGWVRATDGDRVPVGWIVRQQ